MREHVQFQAFRPRLPEVYYARVQDHLLLHPHESQSEEQRTSLSNMRVHQRTLLARGVEGRAQSVGTSYFPSIRESPQFIIRGRERNHSARILTGKPHRTWM